MHRLHGPGHAYMPPQRYLRCKTKGRVCSSLHVCRPTTFVISWKLLLWLQHNPPTPLKRLSSKYVISSLGTQGHKVRTRTRTGTGGVMADVGSSVPTITSDLTYYTMRIATRKKNKNKHGMNGERKGGLHMAVSQQNSPSVAVIDCS